MWCVVLVVVAVEVEQRRRVSAGARRRHCLHALAARSSSVWTAAPYAVLTSASQSKASAKSNMLVMPKERSHLGAKTPSVVASRELRAKAKVGPGCSAVHTAMRSTHSVVGPAIAGAHPDAPPPPPTPRYATGARVLPGCAVLECWLAGGGRAGAEVEVVLLVTLHSLHPGVRKK